MPTKIHSANNTGVTDTSVIQYRGLFLDNETATTRNRAHTTLALQREYLKPGGILSSHSAITWIHFNHGGPFVYTAHAIIVRSQFRVSCAFFK